MLEPEEIFAAVIAVAPAEAPRRQARAADRRADVRARSTRCAASPIRARAGWATRWRRQPPRPAPTSRWSAARPRCRRRRASRASTSRAPPRCSPRSIAHVAAADLFIAVAAVADYTPAAVADAEDQEARRAADARAEAHRRHPRHRRRARRRAVLRRLRGREPRRRRVTPTKSAGARSMPLIIANRAQDALGSADNEVTLLDDAGAHPLPRMDKLALARRLVAEIAPGCRAQLHPDRRLMTGHTATIDVRILDERLRGHLPAYATPGAAGMDLRAAIDAPLAIAPGETQLIPTGIVDPHRRSGPRRGDPAALGPRPQARHRARQPRRPDRLRLPGPADGELLEPRQRAVHAAAARPAGAARHRAGRAGALRRSSTTSPPASGRAGGSGARGGGAPACHGGRPAAGATRRRSRTDDCRCKPCPPSASDEYEAGEPRCLLGDRSGDRPGPARDYGRYAQVRRAGSARYRSVPSPGDRSRSASRVMVSMTASAPVGRMSAEARCRQS